MSSGYNGYTNYQTWATALWMDNEPASNEYLYDLANRELVHETERVELLDKADQLEEYVKEMLLDDQSNGLRYDLLHHAIGVIDWQEIINTHIDEQVKEEIKQHEMKKRIHHFATSIDTSLNPDVAKQKEAMGWGKKTWEEYQERFRK